MYSFLVHCCGHKKLPRPYRPFRNRSQTGQEVAIGNLTLSDIIWVYLLLISKKSAAGRTLEAGHRKASEVFRVTPWVLVPKDHSVFLSWKRSVNVRLTTADDCKIVIWAGLNRLDWRGASLLELTDLACRDYLVKERSFKFVLH